MDKEFVEKLSAIEISDAELKLRREKYKKDCRVKLLSMNDPYTCIPIGLEGTVSC